MAVGGLGRIGMMAGKKAGTCQELAPCPTDTHAAIYLAHTCGWARGRVISIPGPSKGATHFLVAPWHGGGGPRTDRHDGRQKGWDMPRARTLSDRHPRSDLPGPYLWMGSGAGDFNTRICPNRTTQACGLDW